MASVGQHTVVHIPNNDMSVLAFSCMSTCTQVKRGVFSTVRIAICTVDASLCAASTISVIELLKSDSRSASHAMSAGLAVTPAGSLACTASMSCWASQSGAALGSVMIFGAFQSRHSSSTRMRIVPVKLAMASSIANLASRAAAGRLWVIWVAPFGPHVPPDECAVAFVREQLVPAEVCRPHADDLAVPKGLLILCWARVQCSAQLDVPALYGLVKAQDDAHDAVEVGALFEPVQLDGVPRVDPPRVQHATRAVHYRSLDTRRS